LTFSGLEIRSRWYLSSHYLIVWRGATSKNRRMDNPSVADLVVSLHANIDSIHQCVQSLSDTRKHDVEMERLEQEREARIRELVAKYEGAAKALAEKRRKEGEKVAQKRRIEEERIMEMRRREDEERRQRAEQEEAERERRKQEEDEEREREVDIKRREANEDVEREVSILVLMEVCANYISWRSWKTIWRGGSRKAGKN